MKNSTALLPLSLSLLVACAPGHEGAEAHEAPAAQQGGGPGLSAPPALQGPSQGLGKHVDAQPALARSVDWFDGEAAVTCWVSEVLISESGADEDGRLGMLTEFPGASAVYDRGYQRVWQLPAGTSVEFALQQLRLRDPERSFSHVFHRGAGAGTPYLTFPGGVFVTLDPELSEAEARAWLLGRSLAIERKLPLEGNVFHVLSGPGLEALALAEELRGERPVRSTAPNLWEPLALR
ncbi:MAG TPA: hypothetical protein VMT18_05050 [Planctomycetota bacterium]|nr:hypothetical protein [Planctomycetota bacterium]